jgi:hypothetical protein
MLIWMNVPLSMANDPPCHPWVFAHPGGMLLLFECLEGLRDR